MPIDRGPWTPYAEDIRMRLRIAASDASSAALPGRLDAWPATGCLTTGQHHVIPEPPAATLGRAGQCAHRTEHDLASALRDREPGYLADRGLHAAAREPRPSRRPSPQPITGQHLVRPDGTVNLGVYGVVSVAGLTTDQAKEAVRRHVYEQLRVIERHVRRQDDSAAGRSEQALRGRGCRRLQQQGLLRDHRRGRLRRADLPLPDPGVRDRARRPVEHQRAAGGRIQAARLGRPPDAARDISRIRSCRSTTSA